MRRRRFFRLRRAFFGRRPPLAGRRTSSTLTGTSDTRLGRSVEPLVAAHPGRSGIFALREGSDAFAARVLLADAAERTLDIRYYIWRKDMSGTLLMDAVRRAASRGVRVRLLLDDIDTQGLDGFLAALTTHPNIEVRLFNPFVYRRLRTLNYLTDLHRLNRRMHNKSFTADGEVTIVGGRNVGDEYFDAGQQLSFVDLDVLAIGPVVRDVCSDFDRYWASESSYPAETILRRADAGAIRVLAAAAAAVMRNPAARSYIHALATSTFVRDLLAGRLQYDWAVTRMISDDPSKGLGRAAHAEMLPQRLARVLGDTRQALHLVSPYLVPTRQGMRAFAGLAAQGLAICALTNSLEATDHVIVHSGYAKWRRRLLALGLRLYELKRTQPRPPGRRHRRRGVLRASLHAKTFAIDHARVFVGSFNFDPRSERLNTEMGFLIDSPALAQSIAASFAADIPATSYEPRLSAAGRLQWLERRGSELVLHDTEPGATIWQRCLAWLLAQLPIDSLL